MKFRRMDSKSIGRYLRYYRKMAGMTAKFAGDHIGRSQQWIYNVESGSASLEPRAMYALLDLYGVRPDDAFTESWDTVDDPSRSKNSSSKRLLELQEVFSALDESDQRLVLSLARRIAENDRA